MTRHLIRIITATVTGLGLSVAAHAETLEEIYQQALHNDHEYKAAQAALAAGRENRAIGRANLLPQIGGDYTWSRTETTQTDQGNGDSEFTTTTKRWGATLRQPLFDLSAWYGYQSGKALSNLAEARFAIAQEDLILRTAGAYFDALNAMDDLESAMAEESALRQQLEQTRQRFEVGLTAITEVHEAQAAYDSAVALRLTAEGNLGIAFEALEVLTGHAYQRLAPIQENFPVENPVPADRHEWVQTAVENNYSLRTAALTAEASRDTARARRSDHLPTVYGNLSYTDTNTDREAGSGVIPGQPVTGPGNTIVTEGEDTTISVTVDIPLFTGGGTSARRRQAQQEYLEAQENFYQAQRDVIQLTRSLHLSVETSVASVKARQQAIVSSRSALEATQAGYDVGTRDLVDVLNAQRALYAAQRDYYDALYTYVLNSLQLKSAAGTLTGEDVADLNRWLNAQNQVGPGDLTERR